MSDWIQPEQFDALFIQDTPLLDLRAPAEFSKGAFPTAENQPLMTDQERKRVGICYKEQGQDAAIALGHELVSGNIKQHRIDEWTAFAHAHPNAVLYCFRGGLRSHIVQHWLQQQQVVIPRVNGGYKAMRQHLMNALDTLVPQFDWVVVSGRTGCQKTTFINQTPHSIDLEGLAHHRGSAFGRYPEPQPTQIDFENRLAIKLLKLKAVNAHTLYIEDEDSHIGSVSIPHTLRSAMQQAKRHCIECTLDHRVNVIYQEYVVDAERRYGSRERFEDYLLDSLQRTRKRLGDLRFRSLFQLLQQALASNSETLHKAWIEQLLTEYYDPMYDYQMKKR